MKPINAGSVNGGILGIVLKALNYAYLAFMAMVAIGLFVLVSKTHSSLPSTEFWSYGEQQAVK